MGSSPWCWVEMGLDPGGRWGHPSPFLGPAHHLQSSLLGVGQRLVLLNTLGAKCSAPDRWINDRRLLWTNL